MSVLVYRRPRTISIRDTKQVISSERPHVKAPLRRQIHEPLLAFEDLPGWFQDNPSIRTGYRAINHSYGKCFRSCARMHNETLNIFTHMVPAIILFVAQYSVQHAITSYYPQASLTDRLIFALNVLAATVTFTLSALYHTLMCHSEHISGLWLRIDYMGILTLIVGSFYSGIYVGFYCEPGPRNLHWSMITLFSLVAAILVAHPRLQSHKYRFHKALAFIATAMTGFTPITHGLMKYGWGEMWLRSGMPFWLLEGVVYSIGALFFITQFPESRWPGSFDVYFNSHSIFHVLVVGASLVHMYGVWSAYDWNYRHGRLCHTIS